MQREITAKGHTQRTFGGYATMVSVLIIGAITVAITTSLLLLGVGSLKSTLTLEQGVTARVLARSCGEEALQKIHDDTTYTGTGTLTVNDHTCSYNIENSGGSGKTITANATVSRAVARIAIEVSATSPKVVTSSWREVAE